MFDIDVHIIHYLEPQWMLDRCLASIEGQPVNIHIIKGVEEWPPFKGRKKGFAAGTAKYCSYVDPDDEVMPGAYETLIQHDGYDLIWGNELIYSREKVVTFTGIHHAYLIKRDLPIEHCGEFRVLRRIRDSDRSKHINQILYKHYAFIGTGQRKRDAIHGTGLLHRNERAVMERR
jgi:hypothetical protein